MKGWYASIRDRASEGVQIPLIAPQRETNKRLSQAREIEYTLRGELILVGGCKAVPVTERLIYHHQVSTRSPGEDRAHSHPADGGNVVVAVSRVYGFSLLLILLMIGCDHAVDKLTNPGDTVLSSADDSGISLELRELYWRDATILAVRWINETGGTQNEEVEIPQILIRPYYNALICVHNARRLAVRDKIVELHKIHAFEEPHLTECIISILDTTSWVGCWLGSTDCMRNATVDSLVNSFDLEILNPRHGDIHDDWSFLIRADRPLNLSALCQVLEEVPGVRYAERNAFTTLGGHEDIIAELHSNAIELNYVFSDFHGSVGFSARLNVYAYGAVEYLGP